MKKVGNEYEVEIQYKKGGKVSHQTVAVVLVASTAANVADLRTAIWNALQTGHKYRIF